MMQNITKKWILVAINLWWSYQTKYFCHLSLVFLPPHVMNRNRLNLFHRFVGGRKSSSMKSVHTNFRVEFSPRWNLLQRKTCPYIQFLNKYFCWIRNPTSKHMTSQTEINIQVSQIIAKWLFHLTYNYASSSIELTEVTLTILEKWHKKWHLKLSQGKHTSFS